MLTDEEIKEKGYEEVASNLYLKDGELYVQQMGKMDLASDLSNEVLNSITDFEAYKKLSKKKEEKSPKKKEEKPVEKKPSEAIVTKEEYMRGTQEKIVRLMDTKLQLDSIIAASKDKEKPGEGILWHELIFRKKNKKGDWIEEIHREPSVELVDMIAQDMGHIRTKILEFGKDILEDPNTNKKYMTFFCNVEAEDLLTKTTGMGSAEEVVNFDEIERNGRTFDRRNAIRKAERNAKERMIPIPRKALVELVIRKLKEHQGGKK